MLWYKRYVDDTFVIIHKNAKVTNIQKILNNFHKDIQFTSVQEQNNELPFLDVLVRRQNKALEAFVYRKPTYTGLMTDKEQNDIKDSPVDRIIINVPYVGKITQQLSKDLKKLAKKVKPTTKVITVARPPPAVRQMFKNKDEIPKNLQSNIIYQVNCSSCSASYIDKTTRQACRRLKEHEAPTEISVEHANENLRRSARIAAMYANNNARISYYESDSSEDDLPPTTYTSAIKRHII
ncbi:unnamed protein product [Rotaria sp. Silwood2]|nr:unnamed protein product [Rotaria sp. Silwood2]